MVVDCGRDGPSIRDGEWCTEATMLIVASPMAIVRVRSHAEVRFAGDPKEL